MEPVGPCIVCKKTVYCRDGFLDGITEQGKLYCHDCFDAAKARRDGEGTDEQSKERPGE